MSIKKTTKTQIGSKIPKGTSDNILYIDANGKLAQKTYNSLSGDIDHTLIQNIGTNSHSVIDTHIAGTGTAVHGDSFLLNTGDQIDGNLIIDNTATEALLVRQNADGGDVFAVDTTNQKITITGDPAGARTNIIEAYGYGGQKFFQLTTGDGADFPDRVFIGNDFSDNPGSQTFGVFASGSASSAFALYNTMTSSEAFNAQTMLLTMDIAKTDIIAGNVISQNSLTLSGDVDETVTRNFGGTLNTFQINHANTINFTSDAFGYESKMSTGSSFTGDTKFDDWTDFLVKAGGYSGVAGTLTFGNKIGLYIENSLAFDGIDNLIGIKIDKLTTGTNNYGIMLNGDGVGADLVLGAGQDAKIYYDGTDLIIDPDVVGIGKVLIGATGNDALESGNITINKLLKLTAITLTTCNEAVLIARNTTNIYYCNSTDWRQFNFVN